MTKAQAQASYRASWGQRCLATTDAQRLAAERAMDAVQPYCVGTEGKGDGRPGPEWDAFKASLPGYNDCWAGMTRVANAMGRACFGKDWKDV